jgi:hypothetical protein
MKQPSAFDPSNWYKPKQTKKTTSGDSLKKTADDSMSAVGKLAITGVGLTMLFGMAKGIGSMFQK